MKERSIPHQRLFHIKRHLTNDEQMKVLREANEQLSVDSMSEIGEKFVAKSRKLTLSHAESRLMRSL